MLCPSCKVGQVRGSELLCSSCWFRLPKPLRDEVWKAWRYRLENPANADAVEQHERVKLRAIEHARNWIRERSR